MRRSLLGVVIGTVLVIAVSAGRGSSEPAMPAAGPGAPDPSAGSLMMHVESTDGAPHAVIVIDAYKRVLAAYHVDKTTGEIALKSVRNLTWDLQLMEFNSREPLPQSIRDMRGELQR